MTLKPEAPQNPSTLVFTFDDRTFTVFDGTARTRMELETVFMTAGDPIKVTLTNPLFDEELVARMTDFRRKGEPFLNAYFSVKYYIAYPNREYSIDEYQAWAESYVNTRTNKFEVGIMQTLQSMENRRPGSIDFEVKTGREDN